MSDDNTLPTSRIPPLDKIFSSKGRISILFTLLEALELNITEIVRRTRLNHATAVKHLEKLAAYKVVIEKVYGVGGSIRIFRLNVENSFIKLLRFVYQIFKKKGLLSEDDMDRVMQFNIFTENLGKGANTDKDLRHLIDHWKVTYGNSS